MNTDEAFREMERGKRVRRPPWQAGDYMFINGNDVVETRNAKDECVALGFRVFPGQPDVDDWEVFEPRRLYAIVKDGHATKVAGSTVWREARWAQAHLDGLRLARFEHWRGWSVKPVDATWEEDAGPHHEYPEDDHWRSLTRDCRVL